MIVIPAHHLGTTRHCAAANCPNDAERGSVLCLKCITKILAGRPVQRHIKPQQIDPTTHLRCTKCGLEKPDDEFSRKSNQTPTRRGRRHECRVCAAASRRARHERAKAQA